MLTRMLHPGKLTAAFVLAALASATVLTQNAAPPPAAAAPPTEDAIARETDALVRSWGDLGWFTGAVLVARGDRVIYRGAAGFANPEFNAPNTTDTRFRLVTITQLFTAAAILRLQDQHKLDVHDPIGRYMTDWPDAYKPITIEQLLVGTSGVKDVTQFPDFVKSVAVARSPKDLVQMILKEPLAAAPGTPGRPLNSNYHLLTAIIERVSGQPYADYIAHEIAATAGLTHTVHDSASAIVPMRADGLNRAGAAFTHAAWFHMDNAIGMADLAGTVDDVFRFTRALVGGRLISPAALTAMTTDHLPPAPPLVPAANGKPAISAPGFGYGLTLISASPRQWTSGGLINGFTTSLTYLPDSETTIVVLSNVGGAGEVGVIVRSILNGVLAGKPVYHPERRLAVAPRPQDLAAVAGTWELANAFVITGTTRTPLQATVRVDGERVFVKLSTGAEVEWKSDGPGQFFNPTSDARIVLALDKPGTGQYIAFGGPNPLTKKPAS